MHPITIKVGTVDDTEPLFPLTDAQIETFQEGDVVQVGILEKGMQSGNVSVAFMIETPHGIVMAQMSADQMEVIAAAVRAACIRFKR